MLSTTVVAAKGIMSQRLRICQLNTLAHSLKEEESDSDFEKRTANHFRHISDILPHIIALEEVDNPRNVVLDAKMPPVDAPDIARRVLVHSKTLPMLLSESLPYQFVHHGKTNGTCDCVYLGVDSRYGSIQHHEAFRFEPSASQFALIAVVNVGLGGQLLVVAQHAKAGRTTEDEHTRIDQSKQLLTHLQTTPRYSTLLAAGRLIWLGDFNAGPHSYDGKYPDEWYARVIESTRKTPSGGDEGWCNKTVPVESAAKIALGGVEHPYTTFKLKKGVMVKQTIDYIFVSSPSPAIKVVGSTVRGTNEVLPVDGYPNADWGSDHLSVVVDIDVAAPS